MMCDIAPKHEPGSCPPPETMCSVRLEIEAYRGIAWRMGAQIMDEDKIRKDLAL